MTTKSYSSRIGSSFSFSADSRPNSVTSPLIAHAVAIGDRRPYVSALVTVDAEGAGHFAAERQLPSDPSDLARTPPCSST